MCRLDATDCQGQDFWDLFRTQTAGYQFLDQVRILPYVQARIHLRESGCMPYMLALLGDTCAPLGQSYCSLCFSLEGVPCPPICRS